MSIMSPNEGIKSPVKKYLTWKASLGCFVYYDKEKGEQVKVELPVEFPVLEDMNIIGGYSEKFSTSIYSSQFKSVYTPITVKAGKNTIANGPWHKDDPLSIRDKVKAAGGKFGKRFYTVLDGELVCIDFIGASLSAFFDSTNNFEKYNILVAQTEEGSKGTNTWQNPIFEEGDEIDVEKLQPYIDELNPYINQVKLRSSASRDESTETEKAPSPEEVNGVDDDETINPEDLPF